jgi:mycothiol synthase
MRLRAPREEDFDAMLEVQNAGGRAAYGEDEFSAAELRRWLTSPKVDVERDVRVAEVDGRLVGYVDVDPLGSDQVRWWTSVKVHPSADADSVIGALLAWAEKRAESGILRVWTPSAIEGVGAAFERLGLRPCRHSYRMAIEFDGEPRPPQWPAGIVARTMREDEGRAVYDAFVETWVDTWEPEEEPYEDWVHWTLGREDFDPSLWFLAWDDEQIAGFSLCKPSETRRDTGIVNLLGVRRHWRRRGLGEALLRHSFGEFHRRGYPRVILGVDADSPTGAPRLYERAGMHVVRRIDFYEKVLRER